MKTIHYIIQFTCKDTDLDVQAGRGDRIAMVEFYIPAPKGMNTYQMTYAGAILNDSRFEKYSIHRALSGDQLAALENGTMIKLTRAVKIEGLSLAQIKKRILDQWRGLHTHLHRELVKRYELAGLYGSIDDLVKETA